MQMKDVDYWNTVWWRDEGDKPRAQCVVPVGVAI